MVLMIDAPTAERIDEHHKKAVSSMIEGMRFSGGKQTSEQSCTPSSHQIDRNVIAITFLCDHQW